MRIWDSIRRLSGNTFRKHSSGLSSLGILKNKRAEKRRLQIEQFEDRILLSINSPELNAIFINQDPNQYFDPASTQVFNIAPNSLLLRFNEGQELNPATLATGIQIVRAGADGEFDTDDDVIVSIGWIGLNGSRGDGNDVVGGFLNEGIIGNEVVIRFAETLPDDLYELRLIGEGTTPLKNLQGDVFHDDKNLTVSFTLDLGAQIVSVVPQPITRGADGKLTQARNQIEIYFNANDPLFFPAPGYNSKSDQVYSATTASHPQYLQLFQLIATNNTANSSDDTVYYPTKIDYNPATGKMVLTFANDIDKLPAFVNNPSAARLRVGTRYEETQTSILNLNATGSPDPGDAFHTSFDLKSYFNSTTTVTAPQSLVIHGQIAPKYDPMEYPGARDEPGHRDLPIGYGLGGENHLGGDTVSNAKDTTNGPTIRYYNFKTILGHDTYNNPYYNIINDAQKDLARQIFQMYSRYLGIEFIEDTDLVNPQGTTIATGDLRVLGQQYTSAPGGIAGLGSAAIALMDMAENWGPDVYGGGWFNVAFHEIGHGLGLGHTYDLPDGTIMGSTSLIDGQVSEATYPGDYDIIHGQYIHRPDSTDIDLYQFVVEQRGMFSAEIFAQRQNAASLLDATLTLYRQVTATDGAIYYEMVARNDDYFGKDSFLEMYLVEGVYFIGVAASGNDQYNPVMEGTGEGGRSSGNYELRLNFTPGGVNPDDVTTYKDLQSTTCLVDVTGIKFDGDHDGTPGGEYNYWFNVQTQAQTIYVDKVAPNGGTGTIASPYNTISAALSAAREGDIIRIVGNNGLNHTATTLDQYLAYEIGTNDATSRPLSDGVTFDVPRGVTVMIDAGAVLKFAATNINVGSFAEGIDRSGGSIQVLGTPYESVYFTSFKDQTIGTKTNPLNTTPTPSDWGGISIRNDLDYEFIASYDPASNRKQREVLEAQGIFLNYINHAFMSYGGGSVTGELQGIYTPVNLNASQATVSYNTITFSNSAAISADLSSFEETRFQSWDHDPNTIFTLGYTRIGPNVYGNTVIDNSVNGLAVRAKSVTSTTAQQKVTGNIRFSATDIVYVMQDNIVIQGTTGEYHTTPVTASALSVEYLQYNSAAHSLGGNQLNDRLYDGNLILTAIPADGEYFSLADGTTTLVFEFNHIDKPNHGGVRTGRVQVDINSTDSLPVIMQKLIAVINSFSDANYLANYRTYITGVGSQMVKPFKITAALLGGNIVLSSTGTILEVEGTGLVKANSAGRLMVDPGVIIKALNSRIEAEMGAVFLAEGTVAHPIIMTSLHDTRFGAGGSYTTFTNRNSITYIPMEGNWSGIFFGPDSFGSLDHVVIAFAGGTSATEGSTNTGFNPVEIHQADVRIANSRFEHNTGVIRGDSGSSSGQVGRGSATPAVIFVRGAQPVIVNNEFFNNTNGLTNNANALAVVSINVNALTDESVIDWGRSTGSVSNYSEYNDNYGALVRNNRFTGNSVNGMVVRGEVMTVAGVWDDADIVHVVYTEIKIPNFHTKGGLRLMSAPEQSLVIKLLGANAGFTTLGTPFEYIDRIGGALQIVGVPNYPVVLTSLRDDTVGAGFDLKRRVMFDTNNDAERSQAAPGDWRSIKFDSYSNDRNVVVVTEWEKVANEAEDRNGTPAKAQYLGRLATQDKAGDDIYHLGYEIFGSIRSDKPNEADVYSFMATPGTEIWLDIDATARDLDLIIEVIDAQGNVLARSHNAYMEERGYGATLNSANGLNETGLNEVESYEGTKAYTMNKDRWHRIDNYSINQRDPGLRFIAPGNPGDGEKLYYVRVSSALGIADANKVTQAASAGKTFTISDDSGSIFSFIFDFTRDANNADYLAGNKVGGNFIVPMMGVANTNEAKQKAIIDAINKTNEVYLSHGKNVNYGQGIATARLAYIYDVNGTVLSYIVLDGIELHFNAKETGLTCLANTSGNYTLNMRLQETTEIPGCAVTYADIRYSVNGVEAYGFPQSSPVQAEYKDVAGNSFANAGDLGNLLGSSHGTISVSGYLSNLSQVDWYKFSLDLRGVQFIAGSTNVGNIWSAIFDIDYADVLVRPDLTLWVFDSGGRLIYIGGDSNVADDQYDPNLTTNIEKLSAGSAGPYDPFIGPAGLVAGIDGGSSSTYYVAVTSATAFADVLRSTQTRLEPIDSIKRIVEERVDRGQDMDYVSEQVEISSRLTLTPDEYKLSDVVTYVGNSGGLWMIDPFTGDMEIVRSYNGAFPNNCGVELRDNGKLYTIAGSGNVPNYYEINQAQVTGSISSISTEIQAKWYYLNNTTVVWNNSSYRPITMATSNWGTIYTASPNFANQGYTLSIGTVNGFSNAFYDDQTGAIPGYDRNVMFLHSANGVGVTTNRDNGQRVNASSGTNQACSSTLPMVQFSEANGLRSNSETIMSMCQGNDGNYYVVTDAGNLYRMNNPLGQGWSLSINYHPVGNTVVQVPAMRNNGGGATLTYIGTCKNDAGIPLTLTGVDAGPRNVEGGAYADKLFLTSTDDLLRALEPNSQNSVGSIVYSPCFVGGRTSVAIPTGANSITFTSFDYNLWHRTNMSSDPVYPSPNLIRTSDPTYMGGDAYPHGATSWYFGLEDPRPSIARDTQPGAITYDNRYQTGHEDSYNTYDVPGGAYGSLTSDSFSLYGYSPEDKPSLYFSYRTESDSTRNGADDLPAVFISVDGGAWEAVAVGNFYDGNPITGGGSYWNRTNEAQYNRRSLTYRDNTHIIDVLENDDAWRQAKIDLSKFAGAQDLRLKFVFSSAGGDIGIGTAVGRVNGSLITAPTPNLILDGRNNVLPGDGTLTMDDSYYSIGGKTFQFVNGYSMYVPATPAYYGNELVLTINGVNVRVPLNEYDVTKQVMDRIIQYVNAARIQDSDGNFVTVKPYLDTFGKPTGSMLSFENAETFDRNITDYLLIGGPQDRTLEDIFAMTTSELVAFLSQNTIPVPFRADMTQSQVAGSVTFMTNLAFNDLLMTELRQASNSDVAIPFIEALLQQIQTMGPTENIINIINNALALIRPTGSTKTISYLEALVETLNVYGKDNIINGGANYTSLNRELERLYSEAANLALAALRNLRANLPFGPNDGQNAALNTAQNQLNTCIANGMYPNRQDPTRIDAIQILRNVLPSFGANNANEQFVRDGINAIIATLNNYYTFHRVAQLENYLGIYDPIQNPLGLQGRIPDNVFQELDAQIQQVRNATTLSYAQSIAGDQFTMWTLWNQLYTANSPQQILDLITNARVDILADPENMYLLFQQLLIDLQFSYTQNVIDDLNLLFTDLEAAYAPQEILDFVEAARDEVRDDQANWAGILQQAIDDITATYAATIADELDALWNDLDLAGEPQAVLDLVATARDDILATPADTDVILQQLEVDLLAVATPPALAINSVNDMLDRFITVVTSSAARLQATIDAANVYYQNPDTIRNRQTAVNSIQNTLNSVANYYQTVALVIANTQSNPMLTIAPPHAIGQTDSLARLLADLRVPTPPLTAGAVVDAIEACYYLLVGNLPQQIVAEPQNLFILLDKLVDDLDALGTANGAATAAARVRAMRLRASQMFSGHHVADDMDVLSINIKRDARTTAITNLNALLQELESNVAENAVDAINRVLHTSLTSTDPRLLINLFYQDGQLLEKILRIDTSQVTGLYGTGISANSTDGLTSLTNSVQMSLVNSVPVGFAGPLNVQTAALDGTRATGLTAGNNNVLSSINRSQNNQHSGFYIDNIIIGFASRGEMVTNAPSNTNFEFTTGEEAYVTAGSYQLEIRRGTEYASFAQGYLGSANATIWNLFDINERHANEISFFAPSAAQVSHNQKFSITDGVNTLTFVFINSKHGGGSGNDIRINFTDGDSNITIANRIKDAINLAYKNGQFKVTASTGTRQANTSKAHFQVDLFGATDFWNEPVVNEFGQPILAAPIQHVFFGTSPDKQLNDGTTTNANGYEVPMQTSILEDFLNSSATRLYIDPQLLNRHGDTNTVREKGQLTLYGNSITYSSDYAIKIEPGDNPVAVARQQADFRSGSRLIPGIAITNNVLAFNQGGGISLAGLADAMPFVRIINNTIYGEFSATVGTGISLGANTAATIMNNVLANLNTGIALSGANANEMVYRANTYKGNANNGQGTGTANLSQELPTSYRLFVNEQRGNFYPAPGALIIDSATETNAEREQWYISTLMNLGIPRSAIIAPEYDMYGQLRTYDIETSGAGTGGENPGYDRGAIDRVDFTRPTAALANPEFKIPANQGTNANDIFIIGLYFSEFLIQLSDTGTGVDPLSVGNSYGFVYEDVITITEKIWTGTAWDEKELALGYDYFANYNAATGLLTLTPTRGQWSSEATYVITLNNGDDGICDIAGNRLLDNREDGTTYFTIAMTGYTFGDAPDSYVTSLPNGPSHIVYPGYHLGDGISVQRSPRPSTNADSNPYDDGVKLDKNDLIAGKNDQTIWVKITDDNETIKTNRGSSTTVGYLSIWFDWDGTGSFTTGAVDNLYHYQIAITQAMLDAADEDGYIPISINAPGKTKAGVDLVDGDVFVRFRFSSESGLSPTGPAKDGEVEDYKFHMMRNLHDDETDLHFALSGAIMGYNEQTDKYDLSVDKFWLVSGDTSKAQVTVTNDTGKQAYLVAYMFINNAWVQVVGTGGRGVTVQSGSNNFIDITLPANVPAGQYQVRFRLSTQQTLDATTSTPDGEFVDVTIEVIRNRLSFGTAPGDANTRYADGGAAHVIRRDANGNAQLALGTKVMETRDGRPATSQQDFLANQPDSFDGLGEYVLMVGKTGSYLEFTVTNVTTEDAYVNIWIDLNGNRLFDDPGEHLEYTNIWIDTNGNGTFSTHFEPDAGETFTSIRIPKGTTPGTLIRVELAPLPKELLTQQSTADEEIHRYMRMRLSHLENIGPRGSQFNGVDIDGEVEDYLVKLVDKGANISGYVFQDMDGDGQYGTVEIEVPHINVSSTRGAVVPFVTGSELSYRSANNLAGMSSLREMYVITDMTYAAFDIKIGGKTYDSFIVTDKGAVMLTNWMDYYNTNTGIPSLYAGTVPTFAPFLSNMLPKATVRYDMDVDADGNNYLMITWSGDFGEFGVVVTTNPAYSGDEDDTPDDYVPGDIVTYFYSEEFIDWLNAQPSTAFSVVQMGTNYGSTSTYIYNATQYFTSKAQLMLYLDSLRYNDVAILVEQPLDPDDPDYDPDAPVEVILGYVQGTYKISTYRLNPAQGVNITSAVTNTYMPEHVVLPEPLYWYTLSTNTGQASSLRYSDIQSFGFWFEFGSQRYDSYIIYDNGRIGLVNSTTLVYTDTLGNMYYAYPDAFIELGVPYVPTTPTVDVLKGTSPRGNPYVQIRWNSAMGMIIENDLAGDIVSFFYTNTAYPQGGIDLGGPTVSASTHVYTDVPPISFIGFRYSDGGSVNFLNSILGMGETIKDKKEFDDFVSEIGGIKTFRMNVATGKVDIFEPGISSVRVELLDSQGRVIDTVTTNSTGFYQFNDVLPGDYTVRLVTTSLTGWTQTVSQYVVTIDDTLTSQTGKNFSNFKKGEVSILDTSVVRGPDGRTFVNVEVVLNGAYGTPVTVNYATQDGTAKSGSDYIARNGEVTVYPQITPMGEWTLTTAVSDVPTATYSQSISGDFIAYQVLENSQWKICIYDVVTGKTFRLTDEIGHRSNDQTPSILQSDDGILRIVWSSYDPISKKNQIFYAQAPVNDLSKLTKYAFSDDMNAPEPIRPVSGLATVTRDGNNLSPQISSYAKSGGGEDFIITWMCTSTDGRTDIYCIDSIDAVVQKLSDNIRRVTNSDVEKTNVTVDGKNIVWIESNAVNGMTTLRLYNTDSRSTINLSAGLAGSSRAPSMSGDHIAWVQTRSSSDNTTKIVYYQISTGQTFDIQYTNIDSTYKEIYDLYYYQDFDTYEEFLEYFGLLDYFYQDVYRGGMAPCLDGEWLVWQEPRAASGVFDVMAYNIHTGVFKNLTANNAENDTNPQVVGQSVVWRSRFAEGFGDSYQYQVRFYDLSIDGFIPQTISDLNTIDFEPLLTDKMVVWRSEHNITRRTSIKVATREQASATATIQIEVLPGGADIGNKEFSVILTGVNGDLASISDADEAIVTILDNRGTGKGISYGTAPASYDTLAKDDGARHVITNAVNSKGQSVQIGFDTGGVQILGDWVPGTRVCIVVNATTNSTLNMWVDWNANALFGNKATGTADSEEHVKLYQNQSTNAFDYGIRLVEGRNEIWLDIPADAKLGQTYARLRITSEANAPADMKWFGIAKDGEVKDLAVTIVKGGTSTTDPVYVQGDTLVIRSSAMMNDISIVRETGKIVVDYNGTQQTFSTAATAIREVKVEGTPGDSVRIQDLVTEEHFVSMDPFNAVITSDSLTFSISNTSNITYVGNMLDVVEMRDSVGNDTVVIGPNTGTMTGPGDNFVNTVENVHQITAYSIRGGNDKLTMNGSSKADQVMSWMNSVTMSDVGVQTGGQVKHDYYNRSFGFIDVTVNAGVSHANNIATVIERAEAGVRLTADPETAKVVRDIPKQGQALNLTLNAFNSVVVTAQENTQLAASLAGSAGNDTLIASDIQVNLSGKRTDGANYSIQVNHFTDCVVDAKAGKNTAQFTSATGGEHAAVMNDRRTVEVFTNGNAMDDALLKMIAFESVKLDAAKNRCTADIASINRALIEIDLIGDWVEKNR